MEIERLVAPRSIAVVGASDRPSLGRTIVESLGRIGFSGAIYPVKPNYRSVLNHDCYPSLSELPATPDLIALCISSVRIKEQIKAGIARGVRAAVAGLPGFYVESWHGLWVPKGTPKAVIDKINTAVVQALADPAVRQRLSSVGQVIFDRELLTPEAMRNFQKAEIEKWWPIIKAANIKAH